MAGQGAHVSLRREAFGQTADLLRRNGLPREFGMTGQEAFGLALAFVGFERAGAIDQASAGFEQVRRLVEKAGLETRELADILRALGPGDVGMAPNGAGGGAGRVE